MGFPLLREGYLGETGWAKSARAGLPQSRDGAPLPWLTMPFIQFIEPLLHDGIAVGEFGSGNSTAWLASRVGSVVSVEHDEQWANEVRNRNIENVRLVVPAGTGPVTLPEDAFRAVASFPDYATSIENELLDLVLVDGLDRNGCVETAVAKGVGAVILDNTDERYRRELDPSFRLFSEHGYRRFDFHGCAPGSWRGSCTSLFLATRNCFSL